MTLRNSSRQVSERCEAVCGPEGTGACLKPHPAMTSEALQQRSRQKKKGMQGFPRSCPSVKGAMGRRGEGPDLGAP